jgi:hypothetical protein
MSGRRERHGLGGWFGLLSEGVCLGLQRFGDVARSGDDEARCDGCLGDEGAAFVSGVHGHFEVFGGGGRDAYVLRAVFWEGDFDGIYIFNSVFHPNQSPRKDNWN